MAFGLREPSPGGDVRPQVGAGRPMVSRPRWGREARGGDSAGRREVPGVPEGGGPWGYRGGHIKDLFLVLEVLCVLFICFFFQL